MSHNESCDSADAAVTGLPADVDTSIDLILNWKPLSGNLTVNNHVFRKGPYGSSVTLRTSDRGTIDVAYVPDPVGPTAGEFYLLYAGKLRHSN